MKKQMRKIIAMLLVVLYVVSIGKVDLLAAVNYVSATRNVESQTIYVDEETQVKLSVKGTPPVNVVKPNDVVLILDKSGSMAEDNRFEAMISSAKEFVDLFDFNAHQVGVVDFSSANLTNSYPLTTEPSTIKAYLDTLQLYGGTDTHVAIRKAMEILAEGREEAQPVIVLLTDGKANNEPEARIAAEEAKAAGIVFYTIALLGPNEDPNSSDANKLMTEMATTSHHHHFVLGSVGLMDIYRAIVKEIGVASAYDVVITETVAPQFEIIPGSYDHNIPRPVVNGNTLTWNILELKANTLELSYKIRLKDGENPGTYNVVSNAKIEYKDYAGAQRAYMCPNAKLTIKHRPPMITSITPDRGEAVGGETVTITGENFRNKATVKFGSKLATDIQVVDDKTITATVPTGSQGQVTVTVTNDDSQFATTTYQYLVNPTVTEIVPNKGPFEGGNSVTIKGNSFMGTPKVYFGSEEAKVEKGSSLYIIVKVPKAVQEGAVDITVENSDGTKVVMPKAYTYEPELELTITSITPNQGKLAGGEVIIIEGNKFEQGLKITIGGKEANISTYYSPQKVRVIVPEGKLAEKVDVVITNPDGQTAEVTEGYEYLQEPAPQLTTIMPNIGELIGGELVTIEGDNFHKQVKVSVGGKDARIANYYSSQRLRVEIPEGDQAGTVDVVIVNPDGQTAMLSNGYEYLPAPEKPEPEITKVTPNIGELVGGELVTIEGNNFEKGLSVVVGEKEARVATYYGPQKVRIVIPPTDIAGKVDIVITNPGGKQGVLVEGYEYLLPPEELAPKIISLSQESGELAGGELITIEGENFQKGLQVKFGDKEAKISTYYNDTKVRVVAPMGDIAGSVDVTVINPSGKEGILNKGYRYKENIPTITSLSATSGKLEGGELVTINGTNLARDLSVRFGDKEAKISTYYDTTRVRVIVPVGEMPGVVDVVATNPDGESVTLTNAYEYLEPPKDPVPVIDKFSASTNVSQPAIEAAKKSSLVVIHGSGFKSTSMIKIIDAEGNEVLVKPSTYYDSLKMRFIVPKELASGVATISVLTGQSESVSLDLNIQ